LRESQRGLRNSQVQEIRVEKKLTFRFGSPSLQEARRMRRVEKDLFWCEKNEMRIKRGWRLRKEEEKVRIVRVFNFWSIS
jgi:hypothetical protein